MFQALPQASSSLEYNKSNNVKIVYFGLLPQFIGQHIGGHLLSFGVQQAWTAGAMRVWVHTCSLDHPYALANYQARGFKLYSSETHQQELPEKPIEFWN